MKPTKEERKEYYEILSKLDEKGIMFCAQFQAKHGWYNICLEDAKGKQHHFTSDRLSDLIMSVKVVWGSLLGSPKPTNNQPTNLMPTPPSFPPPPGM